VRRPSPSLPITTMQSPPVPPAVTLTLVLAASSLLVTSPTPPLPACGPGGTPTAASVAQPAHLLRAMKRGMLSASAMRPEDHIAVIENLLGNAEQAAFALVNGHGLQVRRRRLALASCSVEEVCALTATRRLADSQCDSHLRRNSV
jgi:hypothetical protein